MSPSARQNEHAKRRRLKLIADFGGKCWFEGCEENDPTKLQFAHIFTTDVKGESRGRKERLRDVVKYPHCYALACKYHHDQLEYVLEGLEHGRSVLGLSPLFSVDSHRFSPRHRMNVEE